MQVREQAAASEQRTMAAIKDTEKRLLDAIAEVTRQNEARDAKTNERISRVEGRQWWWNRVLLLPYIAAAGEVLRRLLSRLF